MKVRGAARKRQRHTYAIQAFGDASEQAMKAMEVFFVAMSKMRLPEVVRVTDYISEDGFILKEDHAEH